MDRESALKLVRDYLEMPVWRLMEQLELLLKDLAQAKHFDLDNPAAVGAALHGALPQAFMNAKLEEHELAIQHCKSGSCYKIVAQVPFGEMTREVSMELHYAGPQGHTSKTKHQFASSDVEGAPELPGFAAAAPESFLLFVAYHLSGVKTSINKLFLMFADGVDRKKVQLHRPEAAAAHESVVAPVPGSDLPGTKLRIKARGEASDHVRETHKRGDAASGS